jgi:hypothetical protein
MGWVWAGRSFIYVSVLLDQQVTDCQTGRKRETWCDEQLSSVGHQHGVATLRTKIRWTSGAMVATSRISDRLLQIAAEGSTWSVFELCENRGVGMRQEEDVKSWTKDSSG